MIYAVCETDTQNVKIGYTATDPIKRLSTLRVGNPRELRIIALMYGITTDERWLHERLRDRRGRGEWFDFSGVEDIPGAIEAAAEQRCYFNNDASMEYFGDITMCRTCEWHPAGHIRYEFPRDLRTFDDQVIADYECFRHSEVTWQCSYSRAWPQGAL